MQRHVMQGYSTCSACPQRWALSIAALCCALPVATDAQEVMAEILPGRRPGHPSGSCRACRPGGPWRLQWTDKARSEGEQVAVAAAQLSTTDSAGGNGSWCTRQHCQNPTHMLPLDRQAVASSSDKGAGLEKTLRWLRQCSVGLPAEPCIESLS